MSEKKDDVKLVRTHQLAIVMFGGGANKEDQLSRYQDPSKFEIEEYETYAAVFGLKEVQVSKK